MPIISLSPSVGTHNYKTGIYHKITERKIEIVSMDVNIEMSSKLTDNYICMQLKKADTILYN